MCLHTKNCINIFLNVLCIGQEGEDEAAEPESIEMVDDEMDFANLPLKKKKKKKKDLTLKENDDDKQDDGMCVLLTDISNEKIKVSLCLPVSLFEWPEDMQ